MDRDILLFILVIAPTLVWAWSYSKRFEKPRKSDEEEIADVIKQEESRQTLRERAGTDLAAARTLLQLLGEDLVRTQEALAYCRGSLFRKPSPELVAQFSENEASLVAELKSLEGTIEHLRLEAGAA